MNDLNRAIEIFGGRASPEQVEQEIALDVVGEAGMAKEVACSQRRSSEYREMTTFRATSEFARLLAAALGDHTLRHDLRVCEEKMFRMLWAARQAADMLGIPYGIYIDAAVTYLREFKKKRITPKMLIASDVQLHVMDRWNEEMSNSRMYGRPN